MHVFDCCKNAKFSIILGGSAKIVQVLMGCLLSLTGQGRIEVITVNMIVATLQKLSLK
jgi:hypothetical protein